jgi:hypothetical protein
MQMSKTTDAHEAVHALQEFKKVVDEVLPYLQKVAIDFGNEGYKQRQIANKGFLSQMVDSTEILHGGKGLIGDNFDDVAHALQTIFYDVKNISNSLASADAKAAEDTKKLQASMGNGAAAEPETTSVPLPNTSELGAAPGAPVSPVQEVQTRSLEQELDEFPDLEG